MSLQQPDLGVLRKAQRGDERAFTLILRAYENAGETSRNGLEFSWIANPTDRIQTTLSYTYRSYFDGAMQTREELKHWITILAAARLRRGQARAIPLLMRLVERGLHGALGGALVGTDLLALPRAETVSLTHPPGPPGGPPPQSLSCP